MLSDDTQKYPASFLANNTYSPFHTFHVQIIFILYNLFLIYAIFLSILLLFFIVWFYTVYFRYKISATHSHRKSKAICHKKSISIFTQTPRDTYKYWLFAPPRSISNNICRKTLALWPLGEKIGQLHSFLYNSPISVIPCSNNILVKQRAKLHEPDSFLCC